WVSVDEHSGFGVSASWNGQKIFVGKAAFVGKEEAEQFQNSVSKKLYKQGKTVVYVKDEKGIAASIALKDVLRPDMKNLMDELKS
ncbi:heavy metal translocating P-type ATPase, partial [Geobacillus sp. G4]